MSHEHHGRVCHLNGCAKGQTVPVECPACEQEIGRAPKGGLAQASATWDKLERHNLSDCLARGTYSAGGWIEPAGPVMVQLHPAECIVDRHGSCRRAGHVGLNQPHAAP